MTLESAKEFLSRLYKIDEVPAARSYIFPDGSFLHLDSYHSHEGARKELEDEFGISKEEADIEIQGVIRVNLDTEGFIALSKVPPTVAQYEGIKKTLETFWKSCLWKYGDFLLFEPKVNGEYPDLGIHKFNINPSKGYVYSPDEFVKIIRHYYDTGKLEEK